MIPTSTSVMVLTKSPAVYSTRPHVSDKWTCSDRIKDCVDSGNKRVDDVMDQRHGLNHGATQLESCLQVVADDFLRGPNHVMTLQADVHQMRNDVNNLKVNELHLNAPISTLQFASSHDLQLKPKWLGNSVCSPRPSYRSEALVLTLT